MLCRLKPVDQSLERGLGDKFDQDRKSNSQTSRQPSVVSSSDTPYSRVLSYLTFIDVFARLNHIH
jgi:hypothetical protein